LLGGSLAALGAYSYHRGLRYPRLTFEPEPLTSHITYPQGVFQLDHLIALNTDQLAFRAVTPEPVLRITAKRGQIKLTVNNISPTAILNVTGNDIGRVDEKQEGITRHIFIDAAIQQQLELSWTLPDQERVKFAVIGDTGGNTELGWCLQRAEALGAHFLLHLGDFNYGNGDYARAIEYFHHSPIPCYISIGNHDFNDKGLVYQQFRRQLGTMNNSFMVAGTRFVNFDTGADFFPANAGLRGALLKQLLKHPQPRQIFFTHRPFRDPRHGQHHIVGGINEINWLTTTMKNLGGGPLLTGHVHHSAELDVSGLKQYTVGEGLGHEDILLQRQVAQMLIGTVDYGREPDFTWEPLNMPWAAHQSHTHLKKLTKRGDQRLLDWYQALKV